MADRAAIVTGGSAGIGLAIAEMLAGEGYALTVASRRADKLERAAAALREQGVEVQAVPANLTEEPDCIAVVDAHRERFGRLDVLVNNAGIGIGAPIADYPTKRLDIQLGVNLRAVIVFYRECLDMLKAAAAERGSALVVNTSSVAGKRGEAWLSIYSATKAGVVGFTQAMNKELAGDGIKSTALCPAFVDTDMTDFIKGQIKPEEMITVADVAGAVRWLLTTSRHCVVPEIVLARPGDQI